MHHTSFASLRSKKGVTADKVLSLALILLDVCHRAPVGKFSIVHINDVAFATNLDREPAAQLFEGGLLSHQRGKSKNYVSTKGYGC